MSLRVWLPLNGDLRNLGCSGDIQVTNNGATVDNNGKIGKCYSFNAGNYLLGNPAPLSNNSTEWSFCCWFKPNSSHNGTLFCNRTTVNSTGIIVLYYGSTFIIDDGGRWQPSSSAVQINQWNHIAVTVKRNKKICLYLNGLLINSTTTTHTPTIANATHFTIGGSQGSSTSATDNWFNGYINDVRIYDHTISAAEVAEIARGLVLHYKLNQNFGLTDIIQNQDNYIVYNNFSGSGTTGTLTNLDETYQGHVVRRETMTPNDTSVANFKNSLGSHGVYGHRQTFLANTKYVFWIYFRPISHMDIRVGGTASNISGWTEIPPKEIGNGWYKVGQYRNGTVTSDKTDSIFTSFYTPTAASGVPIIIDWAAPHLLAGTTEIPDSDWFGDTEVIDSSGYGHNGTINGVLTTSTNTSRYNNSCIFNGTDNAIQIPFNDIIKDQNYTISVWTYKTSIGSKGYQTILGGPSGFELEARNSSGANPQFIGWNWGKPTATYEFNKWTLFTFVHTSSNSKLYVNGELKATGNAATIPTGNYYIGAWNTATQQNYEGQMSNFRIYCTPLLDTDIKSLYNLGMKIDNLSTLHTYELEETNTDKLIKTGVLKSQGLYENGYANILHYDKNIYIEPDGSTWVHICHHNNPANGVFASNGSWATGYYIDANRWYDVEQILSNLIEYEFMVKQKTTSSAAETKYRWIQSINPMNATWADVKPGTITYITTSGYTNGNMGGMYYRNDKTYQRMCIANGYNGNWFGGIGVWAAYQGGIPGYPNTTVTSGYVDLYARVYVPTKLIKDKGFSSIQFIEA